MTRRGFTLLEVGLAIAIGMLMVAAGVALYGHMVDDAGDAIMRQKLADCQSLIENDFTMNNALPSQATLQSQWLFRRADAMRSPWGGAVVTSTAQDPTINGPNGPSQSGLIELASAPPGPGLDGYNANNVYFVPLSTMLATASFVDVSSSQSVTVTGYAVAGNKRAAYYYFVLSGR